VTGVQRVLFRSIDEMNRKVQKLKDDMNLVREKIKAIDAENKSQQS
jgi:outer membrane murein-binding lipoprotein Lpp